MKLLYTAGRRINLYKYFENHVAVFNKTEHTDTLCPNSSLLGYIVNKNADICSLNVHSSTSHKNPKLKNKINVCQE